MVPRQVINRKMSLVHFQERKRVLRIFDHTGLNGSDSFFNKLEPLVESVIQASKRVWHPGCELSVE